MKSTHIQHLYSRAGFGLFPSELQKLRSHSKESILSELFSKSEMMEPLELNLSEFNVLLHDNAMKGMKKIDDKALRKLQQNSREKIKELNYAWLDRLRDSDSVFREKMTLFWANVFVCQDNAIWHIQQYNNTLREHALGDFRAFVKAIAREPSMSKYLNNRQNVKESPNENFARELMELFTLGEGNYTEQDIKESARAFTGWSFKQDGQFFLRKLKHDYGTKTFLGKTGEFDGDDIIDMILEQKQCARFICSKIYCYFVNPEISESHLKEITEVFYKDYDIKKLMQYIFSSEWFYDQKNIGVKIKSPVELLVGIQKIVPLEFQIPKQLLYLQKMMGQILLNPPNVAGWKQNRNWIDGNTLMFRMKLASLLLNNAVINLEEKGEFEDTFEAYYAKEKASKRFLKTTKNWEIFNKEYNSLSPAQLKESLIIASIDKDTEAFLDKLSIRSNRDYFIQLMSIPEYQLC
jgi:uncharacterized protein (DUF1800 family)